MLTVFYFFNFYLFYFTFCSLIYNIVHFQERPTNKFIEDIAMVTAGFVGVYAGLIFRFQRNRTWEVVKMINTKNLETLQSNREKSNRIYFIMIIIWMNSECCAFLLIPKFLYEFHQLGKVHFTNYFYDFEAFSFASYLIHFSHMVCIWWASSYCATYVLMLIEMILRLAFFFGNCSEKIRNLRRTKGFEEEIEIKKLKDVIKGYNLFHWCIEEINETMRFYMMVYISLLFITLGVFLAILLSVDSLRDILSTLFFPIYLFVFLCVFCYLGQYFSDSVRYSLVL